MKKESNRVVIKTARRRMCEWMIGVCPYCDSRNVMAGIIDDGRYRGICFDCDSENFFSGPMVKEKRKVP
jgi:transposase-like protein